MTADLFLTNAAFFVFGAIALAGALIAVSAQNILRAALGLIVSFMGVAGIYFVLEAEFIGVVQILVYIGAIAILILFAVMLTRGLMTSKGPGHNSQWIAAAFVALMLFLLLSAIALGTRWNVAAQKISGDLIPKIGTELMTTYLLPFEAVSLLLLAALVGAIVIARE